MHRCGNHVMLLTLLIILPGVYTIPFEDYYDPFASKVDVGAAKTCFMLSGTLSLFDSNAEHQGYKCTYTAGVWTKNKKAAVEFCASNTPYPVISDLVSNDGSKTNCGYMITLTCRQDWWQIDGLCYKAVDGMFTFSQAKAHCERLEKPETEPKLAEFYSTPFGMYLEHMLFSEAWVTVPYITEYFLDGVGDAAVFVNDGAFKYDTKQGTLIMEKEHEKHPALCQYRPEMTVAEVYRKAREYEEIYPIYTQKNGINVATSSYVTIHQNKALKSGNIYLPKFDTMEIRERCKALGKVINVESYPLLAIESEWSDVRSYLKDHRFYLTSAYKHDGCKLTDYRDYDVTTQSEVAIFSAAESTQNVCNAFSFTFNEGKRAASMAGMRAPAICALHSFSFEQAPCEPGWIPFDRKGNNRFCHYVHNDFPVRFHEARDACLQKGSALSGFDSLDEINVVRRHMTPSPNIPYFIADTHYWLGGVIPCAVDCQDGFMASWDEGVARNTALLNNLPHELFPWTIGDNDVISYREDKGESHTHNRYTPYSHKFYVCGKYAGFSSKKIDKGITVTGT